VDLVVFFLVGALLLARVSFLVRATGLADSLLKGPQVSTLCLVFLLVGV
jgi:hypothetical protein